MYLPPDLEIVLFVGGLIVKQIKAFVQTLPSHFVKQLNPKEVSVWFNLQDLPHPLFHPLQLLRLPAFS